MSRGQTVKDLLSPHTDTLDVNGQFLATRVLSTHSGMAPVEDQAQRCKTAEPTQR